MLYLLVFLIILYYIYENWIGLKALSLHYFTENEKEEKDTKNKKDTKEDFVNVMSNVKYPYTPSNFKDFSNNVIIPPLLKHSIDDVPKLDNIEAIKFKALQKYNDEMKQYNKMLDNLISSKDLTPSGVLVLSGSLYPRYNLIITFIRNLGYFTIVINDKDNKNIPSEETETTNKYEQLFQNLLSNKIITADEIKIMKTKINNQQQILIINMLFKDKLDEFNKDELEFIYEAMIKLGYITIKGLETIKGLTLPTLNNASSINILGTEEEESLIAGVVGEEDIPILNPNKIYTTADITDAYPNPRLSKELTDTYPGREYLDADWKCQRPWFDCTSHQTSNIFTFYENYDKYQV